VSVPPCTLYLDDSQTLLWLTCRVGQNRMHTTYMTVYLVISLPKTPYTHLIWFWPILLTCICVQEDQREYLEERRLRDLVKKHSEFISYPIELYTTKTTEREVSDEEVTTEKKEGEVGAAHI